MSKDRSGPWDLESRGSNSIISCAAVCLCVSLYLSALLSSKEGFLLVVPGNVRPFLNPYNSNGKSIPPSQFWQQPQGLLGFLSFISQAYP